MKKLCLLLCVIAILFLAGCNNQIDIDTNDYIPLKEGYSFEKHKLLQRVIENEFDSSFYFGFFSLKGLSPDNYIALVDHDSFFGPGTRMLYMHKDVEEPMRCLEVKKITLSKFNYDSGLETFVIRNNDVIESLVDVIKNHGTQISGNENESPSELRYPYSDFEFDFNVRCKLRWKCRVVFIEDTIKMLWYDNQIQEYLICDILDILQEYSMVEDFYSCA